MLSGKEDTPVNWEIQYCDLPTVMRYCKKCGKKSEYICSGEFRVNAQQKALDIWLIYKCAHCNDKNLAMQYAMDIPRLQRNGAEIKIPVWYLTAGI